ncbi:DUF2690 domain-containing protein [Streptomyces chiangmaiensis]
MGGVRRSSGRGRLHVCRGRAVTTRPAPAAAAGGARPDRHHRRCGRHPGHIPPLRCAGRTVGGGLPRCRSTSCQGQLPDVAACDRDAQTKSTVRAASYAVRLEYSPSCGTAWAEVVARASVDRVISVRSGRDVLSAAYPGDGSGGTASPMLAAASPEGVEACAEVDGKLACTGLGAPSAGEQ